MLLLLVAYAAMLALIGLDEADKGRMEGKVVPFCRVITLRAALQVFGVTLKESKRFFNFDKF